MSMKQRRSPEEIGRRYIHVFATPASTSEIRSRIEEFVAGDHITYGTSWGTLIGRESLTEYVTTARSAFPSLSYDIESLSSNDTTVYCQWAVDATHFDHRREAIQRPLSVDRKTMTIRIRNGLITETWQPCDPWVPLWSDLSVRPPNRPDQ